jgi:hypothetical protein
MYCTDGSKLCTPTPEERLQGALELLTRILVEAEREGTKLLPEASLRASPAQCFTKGLELMIAAWQLLDGPAKTALAHEAIAFLKTILPVRVELNAFDVNNPDRVVARVPVHMSQREACERFGIEDWIPLK